MDGHVFNKFAIPRLWQQLRDGVITCTQRNRFALSWTSKHPETTEGFVELGFHPSEETARRFLKRSAAKGKLKLVGAIQGDTGRGKNVYCSWRPRSLEHDYELTKWCRCYPGLEFERGNDLQRGADGVAWSETAKAYLELDTGSMPLERVQDRWTNYCRDSDGYLIVITTDEKRMRQLMEVSRSVKEVALFCRLDEVRRDPVDTVYFTTAGVGITLGEVM